MSSCGGSICREHFDRSLRNSKEIWKLLGEWVTDVLTDKYSRIKYIGLYFKGSKKCRKDFVKGLLSKVQYVIFFVSDITKLPLNGCRSGRIQRYKRHLKKRRRKF